MSSVVHALQLQREQINTRITQLEEIISNPSSGQIVISKAKVELAQLHEHIKTSSCSKQTKELAEIKEDAIASKLKGKLEYALLKAKEDKVRYELDIHHQLLELRNKALEAQYNAHQRTNKALQLRVDAQSSEDEAQLALEAATKALNDAKSLHIQRTQNHERLERTEQIQNREVKRLHEETTKNEVLIEQKLIKAGLSKKELNLIFEANNIGKFKLTPPVVGGEEGDVGGKNSVGNKLLIKSKELKEKADDTKKSTITPSSLSSPTSPDEYMDNPSQQPTTTTIYEGAKEFVQKLDIHRTSQERTLKGLQTEVEKLNDKCSKAQWTELLKLRSRNAMVEDELYSINEWLKLEQTKISTLEAENEHQRNVIQGLEKNVNDRDLRIQRLEENGNTQRERIKSLENVNNEKHEKIRQLEHRVSSLEDECKVKQETIVSLETMMAVEDRLRILMGL